MGDIIAEPSFASKPLTLNFKRLFTFSEAMQSGAAIGCLKEGFWSLVGLVVKLGRLDKKSRMPDWLRLDECEFR